MAGIHKYKSKAKDIFAIDIKISLSNIFCLKIISGSSVIGEVKNPHIAIDKYIIKFKQQLLKITLLILFSVLFLRLL